MPGRTKFLLALIGVAVLIVSGIIGIILYQKNNLFKETIDSQGRSFPQVNISAIVSHNQTIAQKRDIPLYYAISGQVQPVLGLPANSFVTQFGDPLGGQIFSLEGTSVRYGPLYKEFQGVIRSTLLTELGPGDQLYLTYYADFDKGVVMGIIKELDQSTSNAVIHLVDDPANTEYRLSEDMDFAISDPSHYFGLGNNDGVVLREGNIVWGEFSAVGNRKGSSIPLSKLTVRTPPYRNSRGTIRNIETISDTEITFYLDQQPAAITAGGDTIVYQHGPNLPPPGLENYRSRNLGISALRDGVDVSVFMYLAGDRWQALSIGIRGVSQ